MQTAILTRKVSHQSWEGVVVEDGKFKRALVGTSASDLILNALSGFIPMDNVTRVDTEVEVILSVRPPEELQMADSSATPN